MNGKNGKNGKRETNARERDGRVSLIITGPIRDGFGRLHPNELELFEDEASWRLTAQEIVVQLGGPDPARLIQSPVQMQEPPRQQLIFVPAYEITQFDVERGYGAQFVVAHQLCRLRVPLRLVDVIDRASGVTQRTFVPYRMADDIEARQRRELPPIAQAEPTGQS